MLCGDVLLELYKEQDKSQLMSRRIDIHNSIYSNDEFTINRMLNKENIQRLRDKTRALDPVRGYLRMGSQRSLNGGQPHWLRRKSKTLDSDALMFLFQNRRKRNRRLMPPAPAEPAFEFGSFRGVFFLMNYLNGNESIHDENDFGKVFMDFYFQLIGSFKKFRVAAPPT